MSSDQLTGTAHPIVSFGVRVHEVLDGLGEVPAWSMTPGEQRAALVDLARAEARVTALRLRVLAAGDRSDIATESAATSTAAWVAQATRQPRPLVHRDLRLAVALDETFDLSRRALADGSVDVEQARAIVKALQALPASVGAADRVRAERQLVHDAAEHDAAALRLLGRRVFEVLDPTAADAELGRRLDAEERAAARSTFLEMFDNGDGTSAGRFKIPALQAVMLRRALEAFTNPRHRASGSTSGPAAVKMPEGRGMTRPELLGQAFGELIERLPADRLPKAGGLNATVVVLLDYDTLLTGLGTAALDTGEAISAGLARRIACEAGIIPAVYRQVLGGPSQVLDLGREARFHRRYQRIALTVRDRTCTTESCDRPAAWCHSHHDLPWGRGGGTSLANGRLLCPFHHGKAHSPAYEMTHGPTGKVQFHRRQ